MAKTAWSCPICAKPATGATQAQPGSDDPAVLDRVLDMLHQWAEDVEGRRLEPAAIMAAVPHLCAGCHGLLSGIGSTPSREEMLQHLRHQIRLVDARLEAEELDLEPSAEHVPRLRGPGDGAAA